MLRVLSFYRRQIFQLTAKRLTARLRQHSHTLSHCMGSGLIRFMRVYLESGKDNDALNKVIIIRLSNTGNEESLISLTIESLTTFLSKTSYLGLPSSQERKLVESVGQTWECQKLQTLCS